jgi:hypothetical protein
MATLAILAFSFLAGALASEDGGLAFQVVKAEKSYCVEKGSQRCCAIVSYAYPEFVSGAAQYALDSLNLYVRRFWLDRDSRYKDLSTLDSLATVLIAEVRKKLEK